MAHLASPSTFSDRLKRRRSARTRRQIRSAERMPQGYSHIHKFTFSLSTNPYQDCLLATAGGMGDLASLSAGNQASLKVVLHAEVAVRQTLTGP
jgi:hypothetical protein